MNTQTQNPLFETANIGEILLSRYRVLQLLSSGTATQVYLTEDISADKNNVCLLKRYQYDYKHPHLFKMNQRLFETEIKYLKDFDNYEFIPCLIDHFEGEESLSLVEEFIEGKTVSSILPLKINSDTCWLELNVLEFLQDLLKILTEINEHNICHGDLKPNNIIQRRQDNQFCLIDFANARKISDLENPFKSFFPLQLTSVSPSGYLAPEQVKGQWKANSDLYSLGLIAIQALTGINPTQLKVSEQTQELNWLELWNSHDKTPETLVSDELITILKSLVCFDHKKRVHTPREVLKKVEALIHKKTAQVIIFTEEQWPGLGFSTRDYLSTLLNEEVVALDETLETETQSGTVAMIASEASDSEAIALDPELQELLTESPSEAPLSRKSSGLKIDRKWLSIIAGIGITGLLIYAGVVYFGLGSLLEIVGLDSGSKTLLNAQEAYEAGNLNDAIASLETIPENSHLYSESQAILQQWQNELDQGNQQLATIQTAFDDQQWETVLQEGQKMSSLTLWQEQLQPLMAEAQANLDREARQLLQQAINYAEAKEFNQALVYLEQIPLESSFGDLVQTKLVEYQEKKEVRAYYHLQQAYNHAQKREFATAITFLKKIPPNTEKTAIAQQKIKEYTRMQQIKEQVEKGKTQASLSPLNPGNLLTEISVLSQSIT